MWLTKKQAIEKINAMDDDAKLFVFGTTDDLIDQYIMFALERNDKPKQWEREAVLQGLYDNLEYQSELNSDAIAYWIELEESEHEQAKGE